MTEVEKIKRFYPERYQKMVFHTIRLLENFDLDVYGDLEKAYNSRAKVSNIVMPPYDPRINEVLEDMRTTHNENVIQVFFIK
jgi:hypothetical protein